MDAFFVRNGEDAADLFRIAVVPQDPGQQGLVRAVAFVGFGEGTGQFDFNVLGLALEQLVGHPSQTDGTGSVGTGRTDHHRPDNIENVHDEPPESEIKKRSILSV